MPVLLCLEHDADDRPERLAEVAAIDGWQVQVVRLWAGEPVPERVPGENLLVSLGGPMSVLDRDRIPWMGAEIRLMQRLLQAGTPFFGLCLGAQLLCHAAGGSVQRMGCRPDGGPLREVGWLPVRLRAPGLAESLRVLHWHQDACVLPAKATLMGASDLCPVQLFRIGSALGCQFHPEGTADTASRWLSQGRAWVVEGIGEAATEQFAATTSDPDQEDRDRLLRWLIAGGAYLPPCTCL